jgi:putative endonuclease
VAIYIRQEAMGLSDFTDMSLRARYERGNLYTPGSNGIVGLYPTRHCERGTSVAISTRQVSNYLLICGMVFQRGGCVYILTNKMHTVLYIGVTSDITGRIFEHKNKVHAKSFTARYNCDKLVYYYFYPHIEEAIAAEKILKDRSRAYKNQLIGLTNPEWIDLYSSIDE